MWTAKPTPGRNRAAARLIAGTRADEYDKRTRRLIVNGILSSSRAPWIKVERWPEPTGQLISQEVMDQVWDEERSGRQGCE
jgi:hypothetical protein